MQLRCFQNADTSPEKFFVLECSREPGYISPRGDAKRRATNRSGGRCSEARCAGSRYSGYGETSQLGADPDSPANSSQYTARESDGLVGGTAGSSLYYYRARYYDPVLKRFLSGDPLGLVAGLNLYAYVGGDPIIGRDPLGLLNFVGQVGGSFVFGGGGEGYVGIYVTFPQRGGPDADVGIYASGGIGAGYNVGGGVAGGLIKGDVNDIRGITYNANGGGTVVGSTVMFGPDGKPIGAVIGPSARIGLSGSYARTGAWSLREFLGWFFDNYCP